MNSGLLNTSLKKKLFAEQLLKNTIKQTVKFLHVVSAKQIVYFRCNLTGLQRARLSSRALALWGSRLFYLRRVGMWVSESGTNKNQRRQELMKKAMACATRAFCRPWFFVSFALVLSGVEASRQKKIRQKKKNINEIFCFCHKICSDTCLIWRLF